MLAKSEKPWKDLTREERRERFDEILKMLEDRKRQEPIPKTCGEWWKSSGYLEHATRFAYDILEGPIA
jgi:hypothetical protein